jgi:hypothetical protein
VKKEKERKKKNGEPKKSTGRVDGQSNSEPNKQTLKGKKQKKKEKEKKSPVHDQ